MSPAGHADERHDEEGFTLLEVVCALAIIAMLAAVLMPTIPMSTSRPRLEAYALEIAAVLKSDRTAAVRRHAWVATQVNAPSRFVRSGATSRTVRIPSDVVFDAMLPETCNQHFAAAISFFPSGMSCGGAIALTRPGAAYEIRVNWLTGGIDVVPRGSL
jgi:general secretion pathway protein H